MSLTNTLVAWYYQNKRDLPWRNTRDPYKIWLSEIILQQTRVEQGLPYYHKFIDRYPDVQQLADASEDEVLKLWQGLGYYSRARNMQKAAQMIVEKYNGVFPKTYHEIIQLKGIGEYTAAAISSFAFNEAKAVVDGNVFRFLSRYFGINIPINSTEGKKTFSAIAAEILNTDDPGTHNQAIMEFGARQCKPASPNCNMCPLTTSCYALKNNMIDVLPVKLGKTKIRERFLNYFLIKKEDAIYLNKRTQKDIWQNMYDLPLIETTKELSETELMQMQEWKELFGHQKIEIKNISEVKHVLSHQHLYTRFWKIEFINKKYDISDKYLLVSEESLKHYAFPKLIDSYLEKFL
jgi:A/G-specific adenine glycosylase